MRRFSKEAIVREIAKCDLVCSNCHRVRTQKRLINAERKNDKNRTVNRQAEFIKILNRIKDKPCTDCKLLYNPVSMDFDHLHDKKYNIASMGARSRISLFNEIKKCEIVCSNCHRIRTMKRTKNGYSLSINSSISVIKI